MTNEQDVKRLLEKVDKVTKEKKLDLSSDEDLSIAIMNLISIEEHFFFSASKTEKTEYFDLIKEVREMRKELMQKLIKNQEGENWCISKHLLAASMRLMEVGTKELGRDHKTEAYELFGKAYNLYSIFWGINMNLVDIGEVKKIDDGALNKHDVEKKGFLGKMGELVKKAINCCLE